MGSFRVEDLLNDIKLDENLKTTLPADLSAAMSETDRQRLIAIFKEALNVGRKQLHQLHLNGASGKYIVSGHALLADALLQRIHKIITLNRPPGPNSFAIVATGGYGRGELAPSSDIDLLFLLPEQKAPIQEPQVERMLYCLWDLGLDIGHAVRNIEECVQQARQNIEIRTSMLESRFLAGNRELFDRYKDVLFKKVLDKDPDSFLRAKLIEQTKRHEKFGNSLFYLEPNIKENPGGLRDIQTFSWISKYRYRVEKIRDLVPLGIITPQEYRLFSRSHSFLRRVRNALHYRTGRREDRLTFQYQVEIAQEFEYSDQPGMKGVEQFMRRYYQVARLVGNMSWIFLRKYQEEHRKIRWWNKRRLEGDFQLLGDKVAVTDPLAFQKNPLLFLEVYEVAQRHLKSIHPETSRLIGRNLKFIDENLQKCPEAAACFLKMLGGKQAVAWVLKRMNQSGVLGRYIPEFGRIMWQSQHDLFHVYTVDEHTLLAVSEVRQIQAGKLKDELPLATLLVAQLENPAILMLAVLFHDIAKGQGGDHQLKGAIIAQDICQRFGLNAADTELVSWLVEKHLLFSRTAFRRDIGDPETITWFARQIGDPKRLNHLLLLTIADTRAVGPSVWTRWKSSLLDQLYHMTLDILEKGLFRIGNLAQYAEVRREQAYQILIKENDPENVNNHLNRFYHDYFIQYEPQNLVDHFRALTSRGEDPLGVVFWTTPASDTTELLLHTPDHPGLMARISGALTAENVNILSANITTTKDGMAFDIFVFQDSQGKAIDSQKRLDKIEETLISVLMGKTWPEALLAKSNLKFTPRSPFRVPISLEVDNTFEGFTILEITSLDRVGLLFTITRQLERQGLQIRTAKISTYGERAVDVFYLKDLFGLKLDEKTVASLTANLRQAIEDMEKTTHPEPKPLTLAVAKN